MEISNKAKERFCKDCNIPIRIFDEPYFMDRLQLYDKFYGTIDKWNLFLKETKQYHYIEEYFEDYNRTKDEAINYIKATDAYQKFNEEDMNKFRVTHNDLPNKDIYKPTNDGRTFISIDMRKANFSALRHYDSSMFGNMTTWEDFIGLFTDNEHIINSKYIRQVILGNCNPKRHITYEKYLMGKVLNYLLDETSITLDKIVFFSNDEIVIDISDISREEQLFLEDDIKIVLEDLLIPLKVELFVLHKIKGVDGYYKEIFKGNGETEIKFKCTDNYMLPFIIRKVLREEVTENDKVFYHEGLLAKFVEVPEIEIK